MGKVKEEGVDEGHLSLSYHWLEALLDILWAEPPTKDLVLEVRAQETSGVRVHIWESSACSWHLKLGDEWSKVTAGGSADGGERRPRVDVERWGGGEGAGTGGWGWCQWWPGLSTQTTWSNTNARVRMGKSQRTEEWETVKEPPPQKCHYNVSTCVWKKELPQHKGSRKICNPKLDYLEPDRNFSRERE